MSLKTSALCEFVPFVISQQGSNKYIFLIAVDFNNVTTNVGTNLNREVGIYKILYFLYIFIKKAHYFQELD